jgi:hypothetical protein
MMKELFELTSAVSRCHAEMRERSHDTVSVGRREVDSCARLVQRILGTVGTIIIPSWVVPGGERGWGLLDLTNGVGVADG